VTVTEQFVAGAIRSTSFRAVSRAKEPVQVTVAVTCVKLRAVVVRKQSLKIRLTYSSTVKVRLRPNTPQIVRLTCPKRTTPVGPSADVAPVTSPRLIDRSARMIDVPAVVSELTTANVTRLGLANISDVLQRAEVRTRCLGLEDEDGDRVPFATRRGTQVSTDIGAGSQSVTRATCPAGTFAIGVDWRTLDNVPVATLPFPRGVNGLDVVSAASEGKARQSIRLRCARLDGRLVLVGTPPPAFPTGPLEDVPSASTPGASTPPPKPVSSGPPVPSGPVGTGSFFNVPNLPFERAFALTFNQAGTGMRIRTPGHQITSVLSPELMTCSFSGEQVECLGAIAPGVPLNGRIALFPAAAAGDRVQIDLLTAFGPSDPFTVPLIP
jgi:hypothetical protein